MGPVHDATMARMTHPIHSYEPRLGHGLAHDPFNAIVGPRPIGWISTRSDNGVLNLAPYSFFNAFNYVPPLIGFSSLGYKDTVRNAIETGEFVWNLATQDLAEAMNQTCAHVAPEVDEFALAGLTPLACDLVKAPRVGQSPVSFECKVSQSMPLRSALGEELNTWMVFGEVVKVHIDTAHIRDGIYDTTSARPILRGGGPSDYFSIGPAQLFRMVRPR